MKGGTPPSPGLEYNPPSTHAELLISPNQFFGPPPAKKRATKGGSPPWRTPRRSTEKGAVPLEHGGQGRRNAQQARRVQGRPMTGPPGSICERRSGCLVAPPPLRQRTGWGTWTRSCGRRSRRAAASRYIPYPPPPRVGRRNRTRPLFEHTFLCFFIPPFLPLRVFNRRGGGVFREVFPQTDAGGRVRRCGLPADPGPRPRGGEPAPSRRLEDTKSYTHRG